MKIFFKKIFLFFCFVLSAMISVSQAKVIFAEDAQGSISGVTAADISKRVDGLKNLNKEKAASLKKSLAAQLKILYQVPLLNPPVGFHPRASFGIDPEKLTPSVNFATCDINFGLYYLEKQAGSAKSKISMDGTLLAFETNALEGFCSQMGNFWSDCNKLKIPGFFEQFPIVDSTEDYVEFNFKTYGYPYILNNTKGTPVRIVKRNSRPLFIPLIKKDFFQFLIAQKNYQIKDNQDDIKDIQKGIAQTKKNLSDPAFQSIKETLANTIPVQEKNIQQSEETIKKLQEQLARYREQMNAMSSEEANSAIRLDEYKRTSGYDYSDRIVPPGRHEGVGLYKINPNYFDTSAGSSGAQLIIVYYNNSGISSLITDPDYLQQKTADIFNQIDYHQLKKTMN